MYNLPITLSKSATIMYKKRKTSRLNMAYITKVSLFPGKGRHTNSMHNQVVPKLCKL